MNARTTSGTIDSDFKLWLEDMGVKSDKIQPSDFGGLRGMRSLEAIRAGEVLVELPISSTLCVGDEQPCIISDWVDQRFWYVSSLHVRLAMLLLYEVAKGKDSHMYPWILSLPASHDDKLARWTDTELEELQDESLAAEARQQRASIDGAYAALRATSPKTQVARRRTLLLRTPSVER